MLQQYKLELSKQNLEIQKNRTQMKLQSDQVFKKYEKLFNISCI
jgi:hypothetical protein